MSWICNIPGYTLILFCLFLSTTLAETASFTFPGRISAEREAPDAAIFDEGIASAISEEKGAADGRLAAGRKLTGKVNEAAATNQEESEHKFRGVHFLASYCDCDMRALRDLENLVATMNNAVEISGATILKSSSWIFPPDGLTMVLLLCESHASIHTYPEYGACFVDLFTCGEKCSAEKFDEAIRAYLKPKAVDQRTLIRNEEIKDK
jgi:S-adenosylmethionine decarboxylase